MLYTAILLKDSWAKTILQSTQQTISLESEQNKSVFDREDTLINSLFTTQTDSGKSILRFFNSIKRNAYRRPYEEGEVSQVRKDEGAIAESVIKKLNAVQALDVDDVDAALQDLQTDFEAQVKAMTKEIEDLRATHTIKGPIDPKKLHASRESMGKMIFLADRNADAAAALVNQKKPYAAILTDIDNAFCNEVRKVVADIRSQADKHTKFNLQDPDAVIAVQTPLAIAKTLMTSSGRLNSVLVDQIRHEFYNDKDDSKLMVHERDLLFTLNFLSENADMVTLLEAIQKPETPTLGSNNIIRISLKLPPDAITTDTHARTVVLAGLLSDMRQGSVGSCFATSICIMMINQLKMRVLEDFDTLITNDEIVRPDTSESNQTEFVPVLEIGDDTCQQAIYVALDGTMYNASQTGGDPTKSNVMIWESPGLLSACRQLGIAPGNVNQTVLDTVQAITTSSNTAAGKPVQTSMEDIITAIATNQNKALTNLSDDDKQERVNLGVTAFNAETNSLLLRCFESCVAATAEKGHDGFIRGRSISSTTGSLGNGQTVSAKVQEVFRNTMDHAIQFRYAEKEHIAKDPNSPATTGDGHSTAAGAFDLYRLIGANSRMAQKVGSPQEFNDFVLDRLKVTREICTSLATNDTDKQNYQQEIDRIVAYVNGAGQNNFDFVKNCMISYDAGAKKLSDPIAGFNTLEHTPWRDATGNFNAPVFNTATGIESGEPTTLKPRNALELLVAFINWGRAREKQDQFLESGTANDRYMVNTEQHAFSLTPEDDTVKSAMGGDEKDLDPQAWAKKHILDASKSVKDAVLTNDQIKLLGMYAGSIFVRGNSDYFNQWVQSNVVGAGKNTVQQASQAILQQAIAMAGPKANAAYITSVFTSVLLGSALPASAKNSFLTAEQRAQLGKNAARFADTNWVSKDEKNIYFCFYYSPVTDSIQVGNVNEDGSDLNGISQADWVDGVRWDMFGAKLNPDMAAKPALQLTSV